MLTDDQLIIIKKYFAGQPVFKAYLFGSQSRNEANENSDIDILVELDHSNPIGLRFVTMQLDLENLLHSKVDLVSANGVSKYVVPFIERDKQLIYAR